MSAIVTKRTCRPLWRMSAFGGIADAKLAECLLLTHGGRTETSIDLLLVFAPISQSCSCVGGRGRPFHSVGSNMTIGITGPPPRARWRGAVVALIIAAIVVTICLILLGLTS